MDQINIAFNKSMENKNAQFILNMMDIDKPKLLTEEDKRVEQPNYFAITGKQIPGTNWTYLSHTLYGSLNNRILCDKTLSKILQNAEYYSTININYNSVSGEGKISYYTFPPSLTPQRTTIAESINDEDEFEQITLTHQKTFYHPTHNLYIHLRDWQEPCPKWDFKIEFTISTK
ncbi:hypothetical protein [Bacteroides sp.]|uniref:hypothetical protein n=1 Tax=Bacteroides sp. TaxID=29523 RepID=UPI002622EEC2|nr:hypothetical protein [Bacteroides sp.]